MEKEEFRRKLIKQMQSINVQIDDAKADKFYRYMELLLEWNEKMNLTAITDPEEMITKHFVDCATILPYVKDSKKVIDMGTGAGFPGIPLKILKEDCQITLVDSLNKRILFLEKVVKELKLEKVELIHARAEELARNKKYRESYDISVSRAVAPLNVLLEYTVPFVKVGGECICMKGSNVQEEIGQSKKAFEVLGVKIEKVNEFKIPNTDMGRSILEIKKEKTTNKIYPRKAGTPKSKPIL